MKLDTKPVKLDDISVDLSYEQVTLMFLPTQFDRFEQVVQLLDKDTHLMLANLGDFERFRESVTKTSLRHNIRNAAAIVAKMVDIVLEHYANEDKQCQQEKQK